MPAACSPSSAEAFLTGTVHYLDCSARNLGAFGYLGLSQNGSLGASLVMAGVTIAIALFGIKLMFRRRIDFASPIELTLRVGVVLLLAFSWPAVRTLFFDVAFEAPAQISAAMTGATPESPERIAYLPRLQSLDDSIQALTAWGTGREELNAVRTVEGRPAAQAFASVAVSDHLAIGAARVTYLTSVVLVAGGLRVASGLLFAVLPLLAVFAMFRASEGIVVGWLRAMLALLLSSVAGSTFLSLETGFGLPWIEQRIAERAHSLATPSAPTELLVMSLTTSVMIAMTIFVIFRLCFGHFPLERSAPDLSERAENANRQTEQLTSISMVKNRSAAQARELALAGSVALQIVRETDPSSAPFVAQSTKQESTIVSRGMRVTSSPRHQQRQSRAAHLRNGMQ